MTKKHIRHVFLILLLLLFIVSTANIATDYKKYDAVKTMAKEIKTKVKKDRYINWDKLKKINKDIVAWIEVPSTSIDYPVVQTTGNDEYLTKDIHGNYSQYGSIFLDERLYNTSLETNPNNIIYGHNMGLWTNVMFGDLRKYLNQSYLTNRETVILYTPDNTYYYTITSVEYGTNTSSVYETKFTSDYFISWVNEQTTNSIYTCLNKSKIDDYINQFKTNPNDFIENIKTYGNTLTLSTCDTTHNNDKKICIFCIPKKLERK